MRIATLIPEATVTALHALAHDTVRTSHARAFLLSQLQDARIHLITDPTSALAFVPVTTQEYALLAASGKVPPLDFSVLDA